MIFMAIALESELGVLRAGDRNGWFCQAQNWLVCSPL